MYCFGISVGLGSVTFGCRNNGRTMSVHDQERFQPMASLSIVIGTLPETKLLFIATEDTGSQ